ncbi:family 18 putative glycoside hydrolase [Cercophora samala]|uniref:chitinase n=1 Tax=Cercophora samala TaxID=330535 RepID=A0AA40D4L8_9PEZI|nr:family 18 putative glycoside hydrolase [Cercophora samala]
MGQTCSTTQVVAGDSCASLATRCGITGANFMTYNPAPNLCSTLQVGQIVCCSEGSLPDPNPQPNPDGTCQTEKVVSGDGCWALADRCGITQERLLLLNGPNLCSSLQIDQHVCCSEGDLPDFSPQPNPDGSCHTYTVQANDNCWDIAAAHYITTQQINDFNLNTWGWAGCANLMLDAKICLSTGTPPMPAPFANAICGPQVPGTLKPANMSNLANLNPCPLNACCNVWGQCGIDGNFCIPSPVSGGGPGTATPGSNGCIASCGMEIVGNTSPPAQFKRIAYWEAWNANRPCLHMPASRIDTNYYTHVHFAFGDITPDFRVDVSSLQGPYNDFKALTGVKRIMSFGGWTFSTAHDTYAIFRAGVTPAQRYAFAQDVVNFIVNEGLDGVDFDWEYPSAPDIPGIPAADPIDGQNYLVFLQTVRSLLPSHLSIGIAAPASFWYLKGFPIDEIADVVDYIVYMTYDLHGQWDYDSPWSSPGCPTGNCLRHHTNKTETYSALAMVTKAGVPSSKIIIGMALYGRTFQMTTPGCWGPNCFFTGPASGATPGRCTGEAGYISNWEIREIIANNPGGVFQYTDDHGDVLVYNGNQWVSWMSRASYNARVAWVTGLNMGGTSDWAVDLDEDWGLGGGNGTTGPPGDPKQNFTLLCTVSLIHNPLNLAS